MIYNVDGMVLNRVREVLSSPVNDVEVCQDVGNPAQVYYVLLVIKDRERAKQLLSVFENNDKSAVSDTGPYLFRFADGERLCFGFEYRAERCLSSFAPGQMSTPALREKAAVNLVMECLSTPLPWPLLYLVLRQGNVNIEKDDSIFFSPYFDLSDLDAGKGEADCVNCCVSLILGLLDDPVRRRRQQLWSMELIRKKQKKGAYRSFPELYRDIKLTALPTARNSLLHRLRGWWARNRDTLFRVLLVLCGITLGIVLIMLISQLIWGDIPLLRLFQNSFDVIGTEVLNR